MNQVRGVGVRRERKKGVRADKELAQIQWEPRASVLSEPNEEVESS